MTFDFAAMEAALTPRTRMVLLCSPHNPVGRVWTRAELERLADFCVRHGLVLCSDEIHCDLLLEPERSPFTTGLALEGPIRDRLVVMMAASKTYNVPGLGLSFAMIPNAEIAAAVPSGRKIVLWRRPVRWGSRPRRPPTGMERRGGRRCAGICGGTGI